MAYNKQSAHARNVARFDGLPHYQGVPCPHGHTGTRHTSNGLCVECHAQAVSTWRANNVDKERQRKRDAAKASRDGMRCTCPHCGKSFNRGKVNAQDNTL